MIKLNQSTSFIGLGSASPLSRRLTSLTLAGIRNSLADINGSMADRVDGTTADDGLSEDRPPLPSVNWRFRQITLPLNASGLARRAFIERLSVRVAEGTA
jgi:hypothetical protein